MKSYNKTVFTMNYASHYHEVISLGTRLLPIASRQVSQSGEVFLDQRFQGNNLNSITNKDIRGLRSYWKKRHFSGDETTVKCMA